jgi:hypothetical protein
MYKKSAPHAVLILYNVISTERSDDFIDFSHTFEMTSKARSIREVVITAERSFLASTKNCPSLQRGTSNKVAEGVRNRREESLTNPLS